MRAQPTPHHHTPASVPPPPHTPSPLLASCAPDGDVDYEAELLGGGAGVEGVEDMEEGAAGAVAEGAAAAAIAHGGWVGGGG